MSLANGRVFKERTERDIGSVHCLFRVSSLFTVSFLFVGTFPEQTRHSPFTTG